LPLASAYHRPHSLDEARSLLSEDNRVALAGGTIVNADREHTGIEVVDLQGLGLKGVSIGGGRITIEAMVTLAELSDGDLTAETLSGPLGDGLRAIARAELPSTLRTRATVGGTVAAMESESLLAAALLACDGQATLADGTTTPLADLFGSGLPPAALITSISIAGEGYLATAVTGRTPADTPIVAAVAHRLGDATTVALTGVSATPVLVDPASPADGLEPPDDFRGSADYRRQLAVTLTRRALEAL
jgi:CO/xanthine dehydrogenase FAD-binding subunit